MKKLILLEDEPHFLPWLEVCATVFDAHTTPDGFVEILAEHDDRVVIVKNNAFNWATYSAIEEAGHLNDLAPVGWDTGMLFLVFEGIIAN